nr:hypothetical protein [Lysinibacillus timonensis]
MKKEEHWNGQAAMNNNIGSSTIQMNSTIAKEHVKPKTDKVDVQKKNESKNV